MKYFLRSCVVFFVVLFASCHLNQSYATGTWTKGKDTLTLQRNGNCVYMDYRGHYVKGTEVLDTGTDTYVGKWSVSGDCVDLVFEKNAGPENNSFVTYCRRSGQIGRKRIYSKVDTFPSNRFSVFTKEKKR